LQKGKDFGPYFPKKIHIAWIVITETNAEISNSGHPFRVPFLIPGALTAEQQFSGDVKKTHSLWSAPFLLKSCPVVAEKQ